MPGSEPLGGERTVPFGGEEPEKAPQLGAVPMRTVDDRGVSGQTVRVADDPLEWGDLSPMNNSTEMTPQRGGDSGAPA